jgi:hypothetical protein
MEGCCGDSFRRQTVILDAATLDTATLVGSIVGESAVCIFLLRRRVWATLPFFFTYALWALVSDLTSSFILSRWSVDSVVYGRYYIVQIVVDSLLQFSVLVELAWSVLKPSRKTLPKKSLYFLIGITAIAGMVIWPLVGMAAPKDFTRLSTVLFQAQETFAILLIACFLIMASFSQLLSISLRDRELQIATGLGFYAITRLIATLLHAHQARGNVYHYTDQVLSLCYVGTLTYWAYSFATKEQERKEFSPQMQNFLLLMSGGARSGRVALGDLPSKAPRKGIK